MRSKLDKNIIFKKEKTLSSFFCNQLIEYFDFMSLNQSGTCGDGRTIDRSVKNSLDISINLEEDKSPLIQTLKIKVFNEIKLMKKNPIFSSLSEISPWKVYYKFNIQKYPLNGGFYKIHCEQGSNKESVNRIFAWMIYLNDITDKGGTYFPNQNLTLKPRAGDLYIWPASWSHMHCGIPSPSQIKYIATGWGNYLDPEMTP